MRATARTAAVVAAASALTLAAGLALRGLAALAPQRPALVDASSASPLPPGPPQVPADPSELDAIARLRRGIPLPSQEVTLIGVLQGDAGGAYPEPPVPIGLGLERRRVGLTSGPGHCGVAIVTRGGKVVEARSHCVWTMPAFEPERTSLEGALGPDLRLETWSRGTAAIFDVPYPHARVSSLQRVGDAYAAALAAAERELGPRSGAAVPDYLREAYDRLTAPSFELELGEVCRYTTPPGVVAADLLRAAGRADLLLDALRGLNPEGRYIAARALVQMQCDDEAVTAALARLPLITPSVTFCGGDFFEGRPAAEGIRWVNDAREPATPADR